MPDKYDLDLYMSIHCLWPLSLSRLTSLRQICI